MPPLLRLASEPSSAGPRAATAPTEEEGWLGTTDFAALFARLHSGGWTGRLALERDDGQKAIYFDSGLPVCASSTFTHDRLGDLLFREGKLTRELHALTRELAAESGRRMGALLVEEGLLKSHELYPMLRRHVEEIIYSCFAWASGSYRLTADGVQAEDRLRLSIHPWAMCLEGIRRKYGLERLAERVGPPETVLRPAPQMARVLEDCELTEAERAFCERVDGALSLKALRAAIERQGTPLSETGAYALGWALLVLGAVQAGRASELSVPAEEPRAAIGNGATQVAVRERRRAGRVNAEMDRASARAAERLIDRERLLAKQAQVGDGDYFTILGVEPDASAHEVTRAFERQWNEFQPERFADEVRLELSEALAEIHQVLDEAYRVLGDERVRVAYRARLEGR
jgi:hypothetical protein